MERISAAAQELYLTYELYGLLVLGDSKMADSRSYFFCDTQNEVTLEPTCMADFARREVEFIEEFQRQLGTKIRETEYQKKRGNHINVFVQTKAQ
ncbi:hypothetical protein RB195_022765 [Necator americanus]|uniref:Uncharacterized protein n=1 Tax=Necator americanus TaxID=51031 RepID=A0ABR1EGQ0_NECAM